MSCSLVESVGPQIESGLIETAEDRFAHNWAKCKELCHEETF